MHRTLPYLLSVVLGVVAFTPGCDSGKTPATKPAGGTADLGNIILITLDTTRADHLGCYGYFRDTSPNLDRFAAEATLFENAFCPMATTLPTHTSLFTGLMPLEHGIRANIEHGGQPFGHKQGVVTLTTCVHHAGYATGAFVSSSPLATTCGLSVGFDMYDQPPASQIKRPAGQTTEAALKWFDQNTRNPMFLWVHYFDPHWPRQPPPPYDTMFTSDDKLEQFLAERRFPERIPQSPCRLPTETRSANNLYDGEIRYMDAELGRLLDRVRSAGLWDKSTIIIFADHGEGLNQHDWPAHGRNWHEQIHVPLLIKFAATVANPPKRVSTLTSLVDVFPTVLGRGRVAWAEPFLKQATGVDVLASGFAGKGIFSERTGRDCGDGAGEMYAWTTHEWKYMHQPKEGDHLYNRLQDPHELNNRITAEPERAAGFLKELRASIDTQKTKGARLGIAKVMPSDEQLQKSLEELGYVIPQTGPAAATTAPSQPMQNYDE